MLYIDYSKTCRSAVSHLHYKNYLLTYILTYLLTYVYVYICDMHCTFDLHQRVFRDIVR